jgi:catechol 2,3-dioxygenase-like lactoylglutathione lyase family enzyme
MTIKVQDIAFVRFTAPDLVVMEGFLTDFGMVRAGRTDEVLYMRGFDPDPFLHVTHLGAPGFAALAFEAASLADLEALATAESASVDPLDGPGGGAVVKLTDPSGFKVEVVAGRTAAARIEVARPPLGNSAYETPRLNAVKRIAKGPSHVKRLGHCVLNATDFRESEAWYKSRFGLITSDEISLDGEGRALGAFLRCDRGATPSDHHTLFLVGSGRPKFNHAAFEVADLDDLMCGSDWLRANERHHEWGIGRHLLGSQIFDYWRDPWGHLIEHWTDGDLLDAAWGSRVATVQELMSSQWGPPAPPTMG